MFTSSQPWTVPAGVTSAFVTMAGGGGSGAGWRISNASLTGPSGGYVFSQPMNLVAGETIQVTVGKGGQAFAPYESGVPSQSGPPYYIWNAPAGDDGLGGYPGGASMLVSPSTGTLLECDGGSGAAFGGIDNYSGPIVPGNINGALTGSANTIASPNRVAVGAYATAGGPGACGPNQYGIGNSGSVSYTMYSANARGGMTPFGYGSGGDVTVWGRYVNFNTISSVSHPKPARDGVIFIDVLY